MKKMSLFTKIFLISGLILIALSLASFGILYRAQTQQAIQEMDSLLENQAMALSALVNALPDGKFDFEMSPFFLAQYNGLKPSGFFRFVDPNKGNVLSESTGAPSLECRKQINGNSTVAIGERIFRIKTSIFRPEIDSELKNESTFEPSLICLVVGIDEAPYKLLVRNTLLSTIPMMIILFIVLISILLILVRRVTRDLSLLTTSLEVVDFSATHEFPVLPKPETIEVKAVVEKLVGLHNQATDVYREMWLFLGRAAHQLKTPVTAIQATLQVLIRKDRTKEELLAGLKDVELATNLLNELTRKLISSSRISYQESPKKEKIDLRTFLLEQIKMFTPQAEQFGVSLVINKISALDISANTFLLSEIFGNLIENAILYSPRNANAKVFISQSLDPQNTIISITDQGAGFSEQVRQTLFEPFVRGDERKISGSGLGLSIAKKSAQLLGGDVRLRRSDTTGSEIIVILPI